MNYQLQNLFLEFYTPDKTQNYESGASSINGTVNLRKQLKDLFKKYKIQRVFDSGSNDCGWVNELVKSTQIDYQGGDISPAMINHARDKYPNLKVKVHDATTDPYPFVDLLFVRDVAIHLNNADKKKLLQNWIESDATWILITHSIEVGNNTDFEYGDTFPFSEVNWELAPWNFPSATDAVWEYNVGGRSMSLWHRDQLRNIL